jgi:predicted phage-related endonuclease
VTTATKITLGGSEAAAAIGLDPFKSRVRLWAEKTGRVEPEPAGEWALWGNLLERAVREEATARLKLAIAPANGREYRDGFMIGHPDGFVAPQEYLVVQNVPENGVYEGKTTGPWRGSEWANDGAPPAYVIQCHWYMRLTGLSWSLLACLIGGQRLELRRIERDPEIEAMMLAAAAEFVGYVERDEPPPPDGSASSTELLKALYPSAHAGLTVEATAEDYAAALELAKIKAQRKAVEVEEARLENVLKQRMEAAETLQYDGQTIARWPTITGERKPQTGGPYEYRRFSVSVKP